MPHRVVKKIQTMADDSRGATAIEYGLLVALISIALISAITLVGSDLGNFFNNVANTLDGL